MSASPLLVALALGVGGVEPADFPVFVWCRDHPGGPVPEPLVAPFGGVNVEGPDDAEWVLESGVEFYVGHAPGREVLHLEREDGWYAHAWDAFYESRDASALVREPCLSDPATLRACEERLDRVLAARGGRHGRALSLGDEVGLTPWGDPLDLCHGPHCTERWHTRRGEDAAWPETDAVRLAYTDGATDAVHAWLDRRRFHQEVVLDFLGSLARHVRAKEPELPLALFGLTGRTAFGGVDVARVLPLLDVVEAYHEGCARELLYTLREEQRSWCTLFPADGDADRGAHRLWEHWLRGGDGAIVWSDRDLARDARYLGRLTRAVADVRAVDARFPGRRPRPHGVAVVQDPDSVALAWLRDALSDGPTWPRRFAGYQEQHGTRERALRGTLRLLEDCGVLPGALPLDRVGAATVERFRVLVLVHQLVLDAEEEARLAAFLDAGGTLVVRGPLGLLGDPGPERKRDQRSERERDRRSERGRDAESERESDPKSERGRDPGPGRARTAEERLEARAPERVVRLAADGSDAAAPFDYDAHRLRPDDARAAALRAELGARLAGVRTEPDGWSLASTPDVPWLVAHTQEEDGSTLYVALPNLPSGPLFAVEVEVRGERAIELVHPRPDDGARRVTLAPGDALVVRLLAED